MKMLHNRKERDQFESRHMVVEKESRYVIKQYIYKHCSHCLITYLYII